MMKTLARLEADYIEARERYKKHLGNEGCMFGVCSMHECRSEQICKSVRRELEEARKAFTDAIANHTAPERIQIKRGRSGGFYRFNGQRVTKDHPMFQDIVVVDRRSAWGNPFIVGTGMSGRFLLSGYANAAVTLRTQWDKRYFGMASGCKMRTGQAIYKTEMLVLNYQPDGQLELDWNQQATA